MDDNKALRRVQAALERGDFELDVDHFDEGTHLSVAETREVACHAAAFVASSTTDRSGRLKLEIVGWHVSGRAYKVVVILCSDDSITIHPGGGLA